MDSEWIVLTTQSSSTLELKILIVTTSTHQIVTNSESNQESSPNHNICNRKGHITCSYIINKLSKHLVLRSAACKATRAKIVQIKCCLNPISDKVTWKKKLGLTNHYLQHVLLFLFLDLSSCGMGCFCKLEKAQIVKKKLGSRVEAFWTFLTSQSFWIISNYQSRVANILGWMDVTITRLIEGQLSWNKFFAAGH